MTLPVDESISINDDVSCAEHPLVISWHDLIGQYDCLLFKNTSLLLSIISLPYPPDLKRIVLKFGFLEFKET